MNEERKTEVTYASRELTKTEETRLKEGTQCEDLMTALEGHNILDVVELRGYYTVTVTTERGRVYEKYAYECDGVMYMTGSKVCHKTFVEERERMKEEGKTMIGQPLRFELRESKEGRKYIVCCARE